METEVDRLGHTTGFFDGYDSNDDEHVLHTANGVQIHLFRGPSAPLPQPSATTSTDEPGTLGVALEAAIPSSSSAHHDTDDLAVVSQTDEPVTTRVTDVGGSVRSPAHTMRRPGMDQVQPSEWCCRNFMAGAKMVRMLDSDEEEDGMSDASDNNPELTMGELQTALAAAENRAHAAETRVRELQHQLDAVVSDHTCISGLRAVVLEHDRRALQDFVRKRILDGRIPGGS